MKLPILDLSDKNAVLFLWATTPLLHEAFHVMKSWGFEYKTAIYWKKTKCSGLGYWYRGIVEILLFGIKGRVKPFRNIMKNLIEKPIGKHSQKPRIFYKILEDTGLKPRIELFARTRLEGWDAWGDEVPSTMQKRLF